MNLISVIKKITLFIFLFIVLAKGSYAQEKAGVQDKYIEVYGQKIHYLEAGHEGPNVILLHGLGGTAKGWSYTIPALSGKFRVFVPDQIGFGQSDKPQINYRVATMVDFLKCCQR